MFNDSSKHTHTHMHAHLHTQNIGCCILNKDKSIRNRSEILLSGSVSAHGVIPHGRHIELFLTALIRSWYVLSCL